MWDSGVGDSGVGQVVCGTVVWGTEVCGVAWDGVGWWSCPSSLASVRRHAAQVEETLPRERTLPDGERIGAAPMSGKGARAGMQGSRSASLKLLPGETEISNGPAARTVYKGVRGPAV